MSLGLFTLLKAAGRFAVLGSTVECCSDKLATRLHSSMMLSIQCKSAAATENAHPLLGALALHSFLCNSVALAICCSSKVSFQFADAVRMLLQYYFETIFPRIPKPTQDNFVSKLTSMGLPSKAIGNGGQGGTDRRGIEEPNRRPASVKASLYAQGHLHVHILVAVRMFVNSTVCSGTWRLPVQHLPCIWASILQVSAISCMCNPVWQWYGGPVSPLQFCIDDGAGPPERQDGAEQACP